MTLKSRPKNVHSDILQWIRMGTLITATAIFLRGTHEDVMNAFSDALGGHPVFLMIAMGTIGLMLVLGALDAILVVLGMMSSALEGIIKTLERSEARNTRSRSASEDT